jgi:hypothetical protein
MRAAVLKRRRSIELDRAYREPPVAPGLSSIDRAREGL